MTSGDWLFGIHVKNAVRITCVFNAFSMRIRQVQKWAVWYYKYLNDTQDKFSAFLELKKRVYAGAGAARGAKCFNQSVSKQNG